MKRKKEAVI